MFFYFLELQGVFFEIDFWFLKISKLYFSVILIGTGLSAEDLGFESPLCVCTNSQSTLLAETWGLCLYPVLGVCKGTFLGKLVTQLYAVHSWAFVHYRWSCVSLEEKTYLGRHLVLKPINSRYMNTASAAGCREIVKGGAISANRVPQGIPRCNVFIH